MADVIAKLKADTTQWDSGLNKAKQTLQKFGDQGLSADNIVKGLIGTFGKYATATGVVTAALKVAKDAFFANEEQLDEWGRVCSSASGLYDGFLKSINNGDISGYLSNMDSIVKAARDAYDAIDELGTFNAFNQRNVLKARSGLQNAINDYREGKGSKNDVITAGNTLIKNLHTRQNKENAAYVAKIRQIAKENGVDAGKLYNILTGDYGTYQKAKNVQMTGDKVGYVSNGPGGGYTTTHTAYAKNSNEKMGVALRAFNDTELEAIQKMGAQTMQTAIEIEGVRKQVLRATSSKSSGSSGGSTSSGKSATSTIKTKSSTADTPAPGSELIDDSYLDIVTVHLENKAEEWGTTVATTFKESLSEGMANLGDAIDLSSIDSTFEESLNAEKLKKYNNQVKKTQQAWSYASEAISSAGAALSATGDKGMNVAGIIMQAVANIALGFAQADANSGGEGNVWAWIAASVAGIATMVSTIAAVKSATAGSYADGGVIGGNSYSGDKLYARVNSGETILNQQQAQTALDMMNPSPVATGGSSHPYVSGEQIFMGMNNYGKRTGRGELMWSRG